MLLSPHFSLEEMSFTQHRALDNRPPEGAIGHLKITAAGLEQVRTLLGGRPIHINSGYRSAAVNAAVGGVANSAHLTGYAADFTCWEFGAPSVICETIAASDIEFDQLIQEGGWVHLSFDPRRRREVWTRHAGAYRPGLPKQPSV